MATTLNDLRRHVSLTFGLDNNTSSEEALLMIDWANEGVRDVLLGTHCRVEIGDQALTPGVEDYRMDNEIMAVDDRTISANPFPLELISIEEMYVQRRSTSAGGAVMKLAAEGDVLMVWPKPTDATTIRYVYVMLPTEMASGTDDLTVSTFGGLPIFAFPVVRDYMNWKAALFDERRAPHTPEEYHQFYRQSSSELRKRTRRMGGRRLPGMRPGYPTSSTTGRRRDIYPEVI